MHLSTLLPSEPQRRERLRAYVNQMKQERPEAAYHHLNFGDGIVLTGQYDLDPVMRHTGIPQSLRGRTVLDVCTATGALALQAAMRGGQVTAIDVYEHSPVQDFAEILDLPITYKKCSLFDAASLDARFDVVICGSVLLHVAAPFTAIGSISSVCMDSIHVWTAAPRFYWRNFGNRCTFVGRHAADGDYHHYWEISGTALSDMLLFTGFATCKRFRYFTLGTTGLRGDRFSTPHVAVHARRTHAGRQLSNPATEVALPVTSTDKEHAP